MRHRIDHYAKNTNGRDLIVADVHGCFSKLNKALGAVGFCPADRLFMLGDLIDRGSESRLVMAWLAAHSNVHVIIGNHEDNFAFAFGGEGNENAMIGHLRSYGGQWIIDETTGNPRHNELFADIAEWAATLPVAIELETDAGLVALVHADCPYPTWAEFRQHCETGSLAYDCAIASRDRIDLGLAADIPDVRAVVVGHDPSPDGRVRRLGNIIFADSAAWMRNGAEPHDFVILDAATLDPVFHTTLDWSET